VKKLLSVMTPVLLALSVATSADAQIREAEVTGGRVAGAVANGIASYKGIPFAAPPVGALRWKAPQPVTAWTGAKQTTTFGPSCLQDPNFARLFGAPPALSEDCLYLNVWTPAKSATDRLPVMVWIYGGGFVGGMTSIPTYDGTRFASKGVVLVSIAYRLGVFGYVAHPELSRESGNKGSGNYGLQDMIAGLKWVQANIDRFGGDPRRVTIFGESAGGIAVSMLTASSAAKGLFQGAISESGGNFGPPRTTNEGGATAPSLAVAEQTGRSFLEKLGASDIKTARELPAEKLQAALGPGLQSTFWPVFDGNILPGNQYELYVAKRFNDTPVLIGTNSDEGALFAQPGMTPERFESQVRGGYGARADVVLAAYPHATNDEAAQAGRDLFRDSTFAWPTWAWATLQAQKGAGKAFVYYFDHRTAQSPNGANHASEIPFVFGNLTGTGGGVIGLGGAPRPEDVAMSDLMNSYWVNFAKTGDPNGPGLPAWPAFTPGAQNAMIFDVHPSARPLPNMTQLKAMDEYFAWRRSTAKPATASR
jgi:para-nitrobenzyl esterase